jgi:hypothetical protein
MSGSHYKQGEQYKGIVPHETTGAQLIIASVHEKSQFPIETFDELARANILFM